MQNLQKTDNIELNSHEDPTTSRLTVFAFLWACQALVHQEFYSGWLKTGDSLGWLVTVFGLATLLRPSSLVLFASLLVSSICYNVAKWPFVVNHILLESLINLTILAALLRAWFVRRKEPFGELEFRERVYASFAPVVWTGLVIMYSFAFVAKLNWDFVNPEVSCVVAMYGDLLRRFPFLPSSPTTHNVVIALTLIVEALIPLLFAFRRTRLWGVFLGLPFHLILGLVGHRTFSALAFALYSLVCMEMLIPVVNWGMKFIQRRFSSSTRRLLMAATELLIVSTVAFLILADLSGNFGTRLLFIKVYQLPWLIWIGWSLAIGAFYVGSIVRSTLGQGPKRIFLSARPGFLWAVLCIVLLNGFSQYLGLKTETCFTMYSNLRTEGKWNNHMFMPALRLASYQEDLVEVVSTDHPQLQQYLKHHDLITYFELCRVLSRKSKDFRLTYIHNGQRHELSQRNGTRHSTEALSEHPYLLGKVFYFRPVSTEDCVSCRH